jgi:hypothetical protein
MCDIPECRQKTGTFAHLGDRVNNNNNKNIINHEIHIFIIENYPIDLKIIG